MPNKAKCLMYNKLTALATVKIDKPEKFGNQRKKSVYSEKILKKQS